MENNAECGAFWLRKFKKMRRNPCIHGAPVRRHRSRLGTSWESPAEMPKVLPSPRYVSLAQW